MATDIPDFIDPAEDCPWRSPREIFARHGYAPLPPSELDERQLHGRLWEWLYAAAARRFFFWSTDHLSDRELYTLLWERWLDEPTADIPPEAQTNTTTIISEFNAGGMTHEEIWLRYYAVEADHALWHSSDPEFVFPPHQDPPYNRDRFLPVPPIPLEAHAGWLPGDDDLPADDASDPLGLAKVDGEMGAAKTEFPGSDPYDPALEARFAPLSRTTGRRQRRNWLKKAFPCYRPLKSSRIRWPPSSRNCCTILPCAASTSCTRIT